MKGWRPQIDLVRLCTALSAEILAATDEDLRALAAEQSHAFAVAAREARTLIAAASDQDEPDPELVALNAALGAARLARQH
jgi:hypothetical protein